MVKTVRKISSGKKKRTILLVDDHLLFRAGLTVMILHSLQIIGTTQTITRIIGMDGGCTILQDPALQLPIRHLHWTKTVLRGR